MKNEIFNREALRKFIAASMDQYMPVEKTYLMVTEDMIDDVIAAMIAVAITESRRHRDAIKKRNNTKLYMERAQENKRII